MTRVFVYGSLLRGEPNHRVLERARFLGGGRTPPRFTMLDLGAFPGIVHGGARAIAGEVYEVDGPTLERLDRLEGHPVFYKRKLVEIDGDGDACCLAHVYVLVERRAQGRVVVSGDWREHRRSR